MSLVYQWNPALQDEIQTSLDEIFAFGFRWNQIRLFITLRSKISSRSDFIHASGFIPQKADLIEKDSDLYPILSLFLVREMSCVNKTVRWTVFSAKNKVELCSVPSSQHHWQQRKKASHYRDLPLLSMVRETGLEPVRHNHTPLKRARLPVPPLSQIWEGFLNLAYVLY